MTTHKRGEVEAVARDERTMRDHLKGRQLPHPLSAYWIGVDGRSGPVGYEWSDKPHRLVFDLIGHILYLEAAIAAIAAIDESLASRLEARAATARKLCAEHDAHPEENGTYDIADHYQDLAIELEQYAAAMRTTVPNPAPAPGQSEAIRAEVMAQGVDPNSDKAERMSRAMRQNMLRKAIE